MIDVADLVGFHIAVQLPQDFLPDHRIKLCLLHNAAAQNDLAEVLRRQQRYDEAEKFAREAVKNQPKLYVAWETLGSALLDQKKDLDEAEKCVEKAISLSKTESKIEDIRMQITLARVQIARGALDKARVTLRTLRKRSSELSNYDRDQLETLVKSARLK